MSVIGLLILAGGNSRRMGSPKALLPLSTHQTLLDFHINNANMLNLPILLGDNDKNFLDKGFLKNTNLVNSSVVIIDDYIKNAGALSCILSAFHYCQNHFINQDKSTDNNLSDNFLMVISCDNLIDVGEIFNLLKKADLKNHHGAYLKDTSSDKDYPLLGCYSLSLYDELKLYLDRGERSVMKFLKDKTICQISMPLSTPTDWRNLANFNTPDEFRLALSYFKNNPQKEQS